MDDRYGAREVLPFGIAVPCDGCRLRARCADGRLACEAFEVFLAWGVTPARVARAERIPTAKRYRRIFGDDAQHLENPAAAKGPGAEIGADPLP